jgi:hypothetical protein
MMTVGVTLIKHPTAIIVLNGKISFGADMAIQTVKYFRELSGDHVVWHAINWPK